MLTSPLCNEVDGRAQLMPSVHYYVSAIFNVH